MTPVEKFAIPLSNLTTAHSVQSEAKEVERQLKRENKKISELESRVTLFRRMVKHNIPTRDVSSFVVKQLNLTSTTRAPCKKTLKAAMKAKLLDVKVEEHDIELSYGTESKTPVIKYIITNRTALCLYSVAFCRHLIS